MPRKGSLSRKTYFPAVGDAFVLSGEKATCVRSNKFNAVRYGLIETESGAFLAMHSEDAGWLDNVTQITRKGKLYSFNHATNTWQEA
jgi:hypothetical protein